MNRNPIFYRRAVGRDHAWIRMYCAATIDDFAWRIRFSRLGPTLLRLADRLRESARRTWPKVR